MATGRHALPAVCAAPRAVLAPQGPVRCVALSLTHRARAAAVNRATSTLHRNKAEFGPQHVLDGATETCWNSDQGTPQALTVTFVEASTPTHLTLTFQGGFVGTVRARAMLAGARRRASRW